MSATVIAAIAGLLAFEVRRRDHAETTARSVVRSGPIAARANELRAVWQNVVTRDPNSFTGWRKLAEATISLARATGQDGLYAEAEVALRRSLAVWPAKHNVAAVGLLATVLNARHRFAEALALADQAVERSPEEPWLLAVQGDSALALGHYERAESIYRRYAEREPGFSAWTRLAHLSDLRDDEAEARRLLMRARDEYPGSDLEPAAWVRVQLGALDLERGRLARHATPHAADVSLPSLPPRQLLAAVRRAVVLDVVRRAQPIRPRPDKLAVLVLRHDRAMRVSARSPVERRFGLAAAACVRRCAGARRRWRPGAHVAIARARVARPASATVLGVCMYVCVCGCRCRTRAPVATR